MKRFTTILATVLTVLSVASCGFNPAKDTGKFLDKAFAAFEDGDKARAGEKLNDFAAKLDGLDAADAKAFFETYWSYRESYGDSSYGSRIEFDNIMEGVLFAGDVNATATFLSELLNGAYESQNQNGFSSLVTLFERQCYNGDHDRQLKMREKHEAWAEALNAKEQARLQAETNAMVEQANALNDAGVEQTAAFESGEVGTMAVAYLEAFYRAAAAGDTDAYCETDFECGEMGTFSEEEWKEYAEAEMAWKAANPEKWAVIRSFRQGLIDSGYALSILDMD